MDMDKYVRLESKIFPLLKMSNDWPPPPPRAGTLLRRRLGDDLEIFFVYLFISGAVSIPIAVIGLFTVFKFGHATSFPPGDPHTGWVETPETRGTLNIISVCASTIFACVYVSVHVDIPNETKTGGKVWQYIAQPVLRKLYWLLFNIFAPELMVLVALCERWSAGSGVAFMRSRGAANWTMRLAFFADMGGFKLPAERGHKDGRVFNSGLEFYEWFVLLKDRPQDLNFKEIELDIRDRSKRNGVLKVFTCLQATWLLIETVVRFAQHQPVSELEVTTCSYIVCALVTYGCWLSKPYGVERRITLRLDGARIETEAGEKAEQILRESKLPIAPFPGAALFSRAYDDPDRAILSMFPLFMFV